MNQNSTNSDHQEIDLTMISNKINGFSSGIGSLIYRSIQFFKRNLLITGILIFLGAGLGVYMDSNNETYDSKIIVRPNFGSTDYLYNKIDLLSSKIKNRDTVFLKSIGIKDPKNLKVIEIEPIIDIYSLVNYNEKNVAVTTNILNFELLKLLAEGGDINNVIKDKATSKNYYWHTIHIVSNGFVTNENTIKPILDYLNNNSYFVRLKKVNLQNVKEHIRKSEETIFQINAVLEKLATDKDQKTDKLVFYNENTDLNGILKTKQELVLKIGLQKEDLINFESVIKNNSSILNEKNTKSVNGKLKFVLPLLFVFGFVLIYLFSKFYKRQALKHNKI
jgi:hypothetical protein